MDAMTWNQELSLFAKDLMADVMTRHPVFYNLPRKQGVSRYFTDDIGKCVMINWCKVRPDLERKLRDDFPRFLKSEDSFQAYLKCFRDIVMKNEHDSVNQILNLSAVLLGILSFVHKRGITHYVLSASDYLLFMLSNIDSGEFCRKDGWKLLASTAEKLAKGYNEELIRRQYLLSYVCNFEAPNWTTSQRENKILRAHRGMVNDVIEVNFREASKTLKESKLELRSDLINAEVAPSESTEKSSHGKFKISDESENSRTLQESKLELRSDLMNAEVAPSESTEKSSQGKFKISEESENSGTLQENKLELISDLMDAEVALNESTEKSFQGNFKISNESENLDGFYARPISVLWEANLEIKILSPLEPLKSPGKEPHSFLYTELSSVSEAENFPMECSKVDECNNAGNSESSKLLQSKRVSPVNFSKLVETKDHKFRISETLEIIHPESSITECKAKDYGLFQQLQSKQEQNPVKYIKSDEIKDSSSRISGTIGLSVQDLKIDECCTRYSEFGLLQSPMQNTIKFPNPIKTENPSSLTSDRLITGQNFRENPEKGELFERIKSNVECTKSNENSFSEPENNTLKPPGHDLDNSDGDLLDEMDKFFREAIFKDFQGRFLSDEEIKRIFNSDSTSFEPNAEVSSMPESSDKAYVRTPEPEVALKITLTERSLHGVIESVQTTSVKSNLNNTLEGNSNNPQLISCEKVPTTHMENITAEGPSVKIKDSHFKKSTYVKDSRSPSHVTCGGGDAKNKTPRRNDKAAFINDKSLASGKLKSESHNASKGEKTDNRLGLKTKKSESAENLSSEGLKTPRDRVLPKIQSKSAEKTAGRRLSLTRTSSDEPKSSPRLATSKPNTKAISSDESKPLNVLAAKSKSGAKDNPPHPSKSTDTTSVSVLKHKPRAKGPTTFCDKEKAKSCDPGKKTGTEISTISTLTKSLQQQASEIKSENSKDDSSTGTDVKEKTANVRKTDDIKSNTSVASTLTTKSTDHTNKSSLKRNVPEKNSATDSKKDKPRWR